MFLCANSQLRLHYTSKRLHDFRPTQPSFLHARRENSTVLIEFSFSICINESMLCFIRCHITPNNFLGLRLDLVKHCIITRVLWIIVSCLYLIFALQGSPPKSNFIVSKAPGSQLGSFHRSKRLFTHSCNGKLVWRLKFPMHPQHRQKEQTASKK